MKFRLLRLIGMSLRFESFFISYKCQRLKKVQVHFDQEAWTSLKNMQKLPYQEPWIFEICMHFLAKPQAKKL